MKMKRPGVYMILNIRTNDRYVGSSPRSLSYRWSEHKYALRANRHGNPNLQAAWNQYGDYAFRFIILENIEDNVVEREQYWIDEFTNAGMNLYNRCPSAYDHRGLIMPPSVGERASQFHKNRWSSMSKEERDNGVRGIREYWKDKSSEDLAVAVSKGWRKNLSNQEPRRMISPSGEIVEFHVLVDFCSEHNLDPSAIVKVCSGKRPSHKGWKKAP